MGFEMAATESNDTARAVPAPSEAKVHLSVVVPVYNEQNILMQMAEQLAPHLDEIAGESRWQFVLVDNGSRDRSREICEQIVQRWPQSIKKELELPDYGEALYQGLTACRRVPGPSSSMLISGTFRSCAGAFAPEAPTTWSWVRSAPTMFSINKTVIGAR